jgi:hypothetical protein
MWDAGGGGWAGFDDARVTGSATVDGFRHGSRAALRFAPVHGGGAARYGSGRIRVTKQR